MPASAGTLTGPPDFVGVGAQKAGTSWWYSLLVAHPKISRPDQRGKELHFFDIYHRRPFEQSDHARYHALFPRLPGQLAGEWSTSYMFDFWVPPLLRRAAPTARILVLLRDPVERYRSGLTHEIARGAPDHPVVMREAFARGLYLRQLTWLGQHFDRERVLLLQYERCTTDPIAELSRTYRFLGVDDPSYVPPGIDRRVYETREPKVELSDATRDALIAAYAHDVRSLCEVYTELDIGLWPNFAR